MRKRLSTDPGDIKSRFTILRQVKNKLACLIFEMLFIGEMKPTLNKPQSDSIRATLFVLHAVFQ